ncbi:metalloregulator ArsR/SmtB family transcription factor [Leifsonia shinshuensis]|uniref:ArsR/SmtB family transcription factor n=1 Tax=Leifsonia shinshuensis TaxID=150026 RepID=UPI0028668C0E|nr:metalloregulator ArsR/SmtB family transcription factor [Leifsonia shinshuensis]MDR6969809.1 DNA-binding transcriptional ArsR family regulator [Leifsonia shinshuensis]
MNSFSVLADPVRRRMVELLAEEEAPAGRVGAVIMREFGIGQPAVSNQLRVLRDADVVTAERQGSQRIYRLVPGALDDLTGWVDRYTRMWSQRLDALETELVRDRSQRNPGARRPEAR